MCPSLDDSAHKLRHPNFWTSQDTVLVSATPSISSNVKASMMMSVRVLGFDWPKSAKPNAARKKHQKCLTFSQIRSFVNVEGALTEIDE